MYRTPCNGGCWFCYTDDEAKGRYWFLSMEFDTVTHVDCLYKALRENSEEAKIMYRELLWLNF